MMTFYICVFSEAKPIKDASDKNTKKTREASRRVSDGKM